MTFDPTTASPEFDPATAAPDDGGPDIRTILKQALPVSPDDAASVVRLGKRYPQPPEVMLRNLPTMEQREALDRADELLRLNPGLASYLHAKPKATPLLHDDLATLANVGNAITKSARYVFSADYGTGKGSLVEDAPGAAKDLGLGATVGVGKMIFDIAGVAADALGADSLAADYRESARRAGSSMDYFGSQPETSTGKAVKAGLQSAGQNVALLPLGLERGLFATAERAATAVAGLMGTGVGAAAYNEARDAGKGKVDAALYGIPQGAFEFLFEKIPAGKLFGDLANNTGLMKLLGNQAVSEGWTEQVTTLTQDFNEWVNMHPEKTLADFLAERPEAAYQTMVATLVGVGVQTSTIHGINKIVEQAGNQKLQYEQDNLDQLMKFAAASALRERSPEQFRDYVQHVVENNADATKSIFVDGAVLNQLAPDLLNQLPEKVREQIPAAAATSGSVEIPLADVLTVAPGTPLEELLNEHARMAPDGLSKADAKAASEMVKQEAEKVIAQAKDQEAAQADSDAVKQTLLDQLNTAGRHSPAVNEGLATWAGAFYTTMAARSGMTAQEFYAAYPLRVLSEPSSQEPVMDQARLGRLDGLEAFNFGKSNRTTLSGGNFGNGLAGNNKDVYLKAADKRLSKRIYFYVDKGTGINPEAGVGGIARKFNLSNVYDSDADPLRLKTGRDQLGFESAVLDAGFSGYLTRMEGTQSGQVIMLGNQTVTGQLLGPMTKTTGKVVPPPAARESLGRDKIVDALQADKALPSGSPTLARWQEILARNPEALQALTVAGVFKGDQTENVYRSDLIKRFENATDAPVYEQSRVKDMTPAVRKLLKSLTPEEQAKVTDLVAEKILAVMKDLPSSKEMAAVAYAGRAKRGWYKNSTDAIITVFGVDAPRFAALLAAMSPQTSVEKNLFNALATWKNWVAAGRPTSKAAIVGVMGRSVMGNKLTDSVLPAWINNSVRALSSENPGALVISGPKVNSFMRNLVGVVDEVTNDAWMANYALVDQKIFAGGLNASGTDPGKGRGYLAMSARVREAAATLTKLSGETWTPAEVQETIWSWAKTLYETAEAAGETRTARQIVEERALSDEAINATPDFSSLFSNPTYANILKDAGYGPQLEALARQSAAAAGQPRTGGEASPFTEDDQLRLELQAARRLERLAANRGDASAAAREKRVDDALEELSDAYGQTDPGNRAGRYSSGGLAPLEGAPAVAGATGPDARLVAVAEQYAASIGVDLRRQSAYAVVDPERAARIAAAYEAMPHAPNDPAVKAAYDDLIQQTTAQYLALKEAGYQFWFMDPAADPYQGNPWNAMRDLRANQSMAVFPTEAGFGTGGQVNIGLADPNGGPNIPPEAVLEALRVVGAEVEASAIFDSDTEPTLVVKLKKALTKEQGDFLSGLADQEAIAQRTDDDKGALFGPMAEKWGPFNPTYFVTPSGVRADEIANPLLADTGITWAYGSPDGEQRPVLANDLFRAVHDAFGHGLEGAGFRAQGEENAWQAHRAMFTGPALGALTSETRGQNSWLNYGPHGESNKTAKVEDTVFAEQKTGLMPEWTWTEGVVESQDDTLKQIDSALNAWFNAVGESTMVNADGTPQVLYHGTTEAGAKGVKAGQFKRSTYGAMGPAVYLGDDAEVAGGYDQGAVLQVYARGMYLTNAQWTEYVNTYGWSGAEAAATADGWAGVYDTQFENAVAVWNPTNIKSVDAKEFKDDGKFLSQQPQQPRGTFNPKTLELVLNPNADLSTFFHETGHFFLEVMADLASQPNAPAQVADDMAKILAWGGAPDLATWNTYSLEQKRPLHERWAESVEQYVMEGRAPSIELQGPMRRFSAWLKSVYKSIKQFLAARGQAPATGGKTLNQMPAPEGVLTDENGKPLVLYHGTAAAFEKFDPNRAGGNYFSRGARKGIFFTTAPGTASVYAEQPAGAFLDPAQPERADFGLGTANIVPAYLRMNNPLVIKTKKSPDKFFDTNQDSIYARAEKGGHDGVIIRGGAEFKRDTYVVFDPKQIVSAISGEVLGQDPAAQPGPPMALNDDIRRVMDRMLATDEQIAQANEAAGMAPDENADGEAAERLNKRSMADLKWAVRARDQVIMKLRKQAKSIEKVTRAEVTEEVSRLPEFQAADALAKAEKEHLDDPTSADFNTAVIADSFGYPSVDAMYRAVEQAGNKQDMIDSITQRRMLEEHGDLVDEDAIKAAANEAVHNEARARSLATELRTQREMLNPRTDTGEVNAAGSKITVNALVEAAKQFAAQVVGRTTLTDLKNKAWQHTAAERRAAKAWADATAAGKTEEAVKAKQDQLLNNAAAKAALEARAEAQKILDFFKRVVKGNNETVVDKGRDADVVNAARAVLAAYGVETPTTKGAAEYLDALAKHDPETFNVIKPMVDGALQNAQPLTALTVDQLRALHEEIDAMWFLAKRMRQMEVAGNLMGIQDAADEMHARMVDIGIPDEIPGETGAVTKAEERGRWLQFARALLSRVEQWTERMDGKWGGPFTRYVFQPIKAAADAYRTDRSAYRKKFQALIDNIAPSMRHELIEAPELNYTFGRGHNGIGTAELLHAILHTGNKSNKRKLLLGRQWAEENPDGTLNTGKWDTFVQRMVNEGKLGKAHYDFAQGVWDLLEETKPLAQKAHRDVFGRYFDEVTADAFVTPFGTYRGGYVPAQADPTIVADADLRALSEMENESMAFSFPTTSKGFTKSRVEYNRPLKLDLRTIPQHLDKVLLFAHMEPAVRGVAKLLRQKGVSQALGRIDPAVYSGMLLPWLNRSARQQVETPIMGDGRVSRVLSALRARAGAAVMFANISNTVQQLTGFSNALVLVKGSHLMNGVAQMIAHPKQTRAAVANASPFMAERMAHEVAALTDSMNEILLNPSLYEKSQAWAMRHSYFLQSALDNAMGPMIWTGAYNQALEQKMSEDDAVAFADGVIRKSQGSTLPEDVSRMETGPAYARLFTQFTGYFNMMANTNGTALAQIAGEMGLKKGAGKALGVVFFGMLAPIWVAEAIAQAFKGGPGDDDGDGHLDDWLAAVFGMGTIKGMLAQVPFIAQLGQVTVNRFNNNPADDRFSLSPAVSLLESAASVPYDVYKKIVDGENTQRLVRDTASLVSLATGIPLTAVARPVGYLAGQADGKIDPTSGADAARGLITGVASADSKQK